MSPAPLSLCSNKKFDMEKDAKLCPLERRVLKEFYDFAKGREWTESENWTAEYVDCCNWEGVTCDETGKVEVLNLTDNGLSGKLTSSIGDLHALKVLDLSDNDIKGPIPREIGFLSNLTYLRLAYNSFIGSAPAGLETLKGLEIVQLHSNRLSGTISLTGLDPVHTSSFVFDCGLPSIFTRPLTCEGCTFCCNTENECYRMEQKDILLGGFTDYKHMAWVYFLTLMGCCIVLYYASFFYKKCKDRTPPDASEPQDSSAATNANRSQEEVDKITEEIDRSALEMMGEDSVYRFFLETSYLGWGVALTILAIQLWMCFVFVNGSEFDFSNPTSDLKYLWECPRDEVDCSSTDDRTWQGWIVFGILMVMHLLKDIIQGLKLIMLAASRAIHSWNKRVRFFLGGVTLILPAMFTLFASIIYNNAIAATDTELISNAVIILFITDLDEMAHSILVSIFPRLDAGDNPLKGAQEKLTHMQQKISQLQQELAQSKQEHLETKRNFASQLARMNESIEERFQQVQSQMSTSLNLNKGNRIGVTGQAESKI